MHADRHTHTHTHMHAFTGLHNTCIHMYTHSVMVDSDESHDCTTSVKKRPRAPGYDVGRFWLIRRPFQYDSPSAVLFRVGVAVTNDLKLLHRQFGIKYAAYVDLQVD